MIFKQTRDYILMSLPLIYAMELVNVMTFYNGMPENRGKISNRKKKQITTNKAEKVLI